MAYLKTDGFEEGNVLMGMWFLSSADSAPWKEGISGSSPYQTLPKLPSLTGEFLQH